MASHRPLTDWERRVISRLLLERPFAAREELLAQLDEVAARAIYEDGSVGLQCARDVEASLKTRIPAEAEAADRDGMTIHYLLHVVDGRMNELEVYKSDSSRVLRHAAPEELKVMTFG
jgi:hypothetical protein